MATQSNSQNPDNAVLIASPMGLIDPNDFKNQSGAAIEDDDELDEDDADEKELDDEPVDEDGDPTGMPDHGEHDHHQDDNYALGGHVTRSGS